MAGITEAVSFAFCVVTAESEVVELGENVPCDDCNIRAVTRDGSSSSLSTISVTEAGDDVDISVESLGRTSVTASSSHALDVESPEINEANCISAPITHELEEVPSMKPLAAYESSTDLSLVSEEISLNGEALFNDKKWVDDSFRNSRNSSSSSLTEMSDYKRSKAGLDTNQNRKRRYEEKVPEYEGLTFNKVPNYYTALSIPNRVMAGSTARSSSDLIADFIQNERDPSPERKSCSVYDKLPAYYSSFTNSTRYDDQNCASLSMFETDFYEDEMDGEGRYGRSCSEDHDFASAENLPLEESTASRDCEDGSKTNTENVREFFSDVLS